MKRGVPALVMGMCHEDVELPSVDHDHLESARHAGALLRNLGHRSVAMLSPRSNLAGDRAVEQALRMGLAGHGPAVVPLSLLHHDGSVEGICCALRPLLEVRPRPTALVVSHAGHVPTALTFLLVHGLRVPGDVSLLSLRSDTDLKVLLPAIACYVSEPSVYARKLAHLVVQLAASGMLPLRRTLVATRFQRGQSLAAPPV